MSAPDATAYLALDPEAHRRPQPLWSALRTQGTIHRDPTTGFHLVVNPDTIRTILKDSETYSSADAFSPALTQATHALIDVLTEEQRKCFVSPVVSIMTTEGGTHERLRRAVNPFFTKTAVDRRYETLRAKAAAVFDTLPTDTDWVQEFCMPFTVHAIADLLGVPDTEYDIITRWDRLLTSLATGAAVSADTLTTYLDFTREFSQYFHERAARLKGKPDGSLLSHLVQQGDNLTDAERIQFLLILFPAGSTTTVILLTHIAIRLGQDPDLIPQLRSQPDMIPTFIEECIVESTPSANVFRTTTRAVTLQESVIPAGSVLLLVLAAANQDLPVNASHLAFGHGAHRCLGAQLARAEARVALEEFLARYESITLERPVDDLPIHPHLLIPTYPHLPVQLVSRSR